MYDIKPVVIVSQPQSTSIDTALTAPFAVRSEQFFRTEEDCCACTNVGVEIPNTEATKTNEEVTKSFFMLIILSSEDVTKMPRKGHLSAAEMPQCDIEVDVSH